MCPVGAILKKRVGYKVPVGSGSTTTSRSVRTSNPRRRSKEERLMAKPKVATTSLAGCFGCHMSLLDIDDRILKLVELVDFDKSPIDDIKEFTGAARSA
jgi:hypothetical protein